MNLSTAVQSSIGRKLISGLTGLLLIGFVVGHLTGNFLLFVGPEAFNSYAYFLEHSFHGAGLIIAELGLIAFFGAHIWSGMSVWLNKKKARPVDYKVSGNAGGASKKSPASMNMALTGIVLLVFVVWHVIQFKFGVTDNRGVQMVTVDGIEMTNLYGRVIHAFGKPVFVGFYMVVMVLLGSHLWHGAWSAFQSLGLANNKYLPTLKLGANALAVLLAVGFLFLPGAIFFAHGHFDKIDQVYMQEHILDKPSQGQTQTVNGDVNTKTQTESDNG